MTTKAMPEAAGTLGQAAISLREQIDLEFLDDLKAADAAYHLDKAAGEHETAAAIQKYREALERLGQLVLSSKPVLSR